MAGRRSTLTPAEFRRRIASRKCMVRVHGSYVWVRIPRVEALDLFNRRNGRIEVDVRDDGYAWIGIPEAAP